MNALLSKAVFKVIKNPELRWKLKQRLPSVFFHPHMEQHEYSLFREISSNKTTFLEYGSGGSTIYLLKKKKDVFSVESNPEFYNYMNSIDLVRKSQDKNLHYQLIDLGATNQWGKPLSDEKSSDWSAYYSKIWEQIDPAVDKLDLIFIDGRFRVSCCLFSILKLKEYNWKDPLIVMHDFWRRKHYHVVLNFLQEIQTAQNLACFRLKDDIDVAAVRAALHDYALDFR